MSSSGPDLRHLWAGSRPWARGSVSQKQLSIVHCHVLVLSFLNLCVCLSIPCVFYAPALLGDEARQRLPPQHVTDELRHKNSFSKRL